jgi:hypothetical protein
MKLAKEKHLIQILDGYTILVNKTVKLQQLAQTVSILNLHEISTFNNAKKKKKVDNLSNRVASVLFKENGDQKRSYMTLYTILVR